MSSPSASSALSVFEDLLPHSTDPAKERLRLKLVGVLSLKAEVLPAAESPLGRLWRLVNSPSSTLAECEEIILLDPALTSRIFRVANSAAYHANASTVSEAIRFVGFKCIREFAFSAGVFSQFSDLAVPEGWDIFWLRNIFVARMTERISSKFAASDGSNYLAGLIHDVGWIFLAAYAPDEFDAIWRYKGRIVDAEHEILPFGHANLGAAVAAKSCLPPRAVDAILYHHRRNLMPGGNSAGAAQSPLLVATIMGIADRLADACELDLFARVPQTVKDVLAEPEVTWLRSCGKQIDLEGMAKEEIEKAQDIYTAFFDTTSAG